MILKRYKDFLIKESNIIHYNSFLIKIKSRKTIEQAINILENDSLTRSFRREYKWEEYDNDNKIIKVYLKEPKTEDEIKRKVKGKHKDLKYELEGLGDSISDIITTDTEKESLKFLTNDHFIEKDDISEIFIRMYRLFINNYSWTKKYEKEWNNIINDYYKKETDKFPDTGNLSPLVVLNKKPINEEIVKKGFDIILKAIDNKDLDIDKNWIVSLKSVRKYNLF